MSTDALHLVELKPSLGIHQREVGTRIHTQTQTRALTILFASQSNSSSSLFYIHSHGRRPARDGDRRQRALPQRPCALLSTRRLHSTTRTDRQTDRQTTIASGDKSLPGHHNPSPWPSPSPPRSSSSWSSTPSSSSSNSPSDMLSTP